MSDEEEGLPLADALRVYGDPQLWTAYESARVRLRSIPPPPRWLSSSRWEREAWGERYQESERAARGAVNRACKVLVTDFKRRLQRGELVATGMKRPISEESERIVIPARLWPVLVLNFRHSRAEGDDLELIDVRVRQAHVPGSTGAEQARTPRRPGPRSYLDEAKAVMLEMAEHGAFTKSWKADCYEIARAVNARYRQEVIAPKTIRNNLGELYRQLLKQQDARINSGKF